MCGHKQQHLLVSQDTFFIGCPSHSFQQFYIQIKLENFSNFQQSYVQIKHFWKKKAYGKEKRHSYFSFSICSSKRHCFLHCKNLFCTYHQVNMLVIHHKLALVLFFYGYKYVCLCHCEGRAFLLQTQLFYSTVIFHDDFCPACSCLKGP